MMQSSLVMSRDSFIAFRGHLLCVHVYHVHVLFLFIVLWLFCVCMLENAKKKL